MYGIFSKNQIEFEYLYFSEFQLVSTNCFSIFIYILLNIFFIFVEPFRLKQNKTN